MDLSDLTEPELHAICSGHWLAYIRALALLPDAERSMIFFQIHRGQTELWRDYRACEVSVYSEDGALEAVS